MKRFFICLFFFVALKIYAQETYFTIYNFTVVPQEIETIHRLVNDYYTAHKPDGITVYLYENHFNDSGNNFTHSIVFAGSLDAIGNMYSGANNDTWNLFITKINAHIKDGFSSATGRRIAGYGDTSTSHPVQRYIMLDVEDTDAFDAAYKAFNSKTNPEGRVTGMGNISAGVSPDGENRWVVNSYKDFKAAIGGDDKLMTDQARAARDKGWEEFIANNGGARIVRTGLRILIGQW